MEVSNHSLHEMHIKLVPPAARPAAYNLYLISRYIHAAQRAMAAAPPLPKQRRWAFYMSVFPCPRPVWPVVVGLPFSHSPSPEWRFRNGHTE